MPEKKYRKLTEEEMRTGQILIEDDSDSKEQTEDDEIKETIKEKLEKLNQEPQANPYSIEEYKVIPLEMGKKYLKNHRIYNTLKYSEFILLFADLIGSSSLPFLILNKMDDNQIISPNTTLLCYCTANGCGTKFNSSVVKLFDDQINYKMCCPKCRSIARAKRKEQEQKVMEEENKYYKDNPDALTSESWSDSSIVKNYIIVKDPNNPGQYIARKRTEQEMKNLENQTSEIIDILSSEIMRDSNFIKKIKEGRKRKDLELTSQFITPKSERIKQALEDVLQGNVNSPESVSSSLEFANLSMEDRVAIMKNALEKIVLEDNHPAQSRKDLEEVFYETISKDHIWDKLLAEVTSKQHITENCGLNVMNTKLIERIDTDL